MTAANRPPRGFVARRPGRSLVIGLALLLAGLAGLLSPAGAAGQEDANAGHGDVSRLNERGWRRAEALTAPTAAAAGFGVAGRFAEARPRDARAGAWEAQAFRSGGGVNPGAHFADGKQLDAAARRERRAAAVQKMLSRLQGPPAFPSPR